MTGEELERAIEFLLQSQANSEERVARLEAAQEEAKRQIAETSRQIAETNQHLDSFADTQAALMQVVTETFAAQNRINESQNRINEDVRRGSDGLRRGQEDLQRAQEAAWAAINRLGDRQERTEASVGRLAEAVQRHLEGGDGSARG